MSRQRNLARARRQGFTLIELLLVLAILVVLGSMTVAFFGGTREKALKDAARGQLGIFERAIDRFHFDMQRYPNSLDELIKKPSGEDAEMWPGAYLKGSEIKEDPWRNAYRIAVPGKKNSESYDIWSLGPDGQDGTDDDIGNWDK